MCVVINNRGCAIASPKYSMKGKKRMQPAYKGERQKMDDMEKKTAALGVGE